MGHMYPKDLSEMLIKRIYAKGKATVRECIDAAKKRKMEVSCAEGGYTEDYMFEMAFEYLVSYHVDKGYLEPVLQTKTQGMLWKWWLETDEYSSAVHTADHLFEKLSDKARERRLAILYSIPLRFAKGARGKYLDGSLAHLQYVES